MKKIILAVAVLFATLVSAQEIYVAVGGGPTFAMNKKVLLKSSGLEGSYGEGAQIQLRLGYMATEKFGVDLGIGYLNGETQKLAEADGLLLNARGKAFGATLAGVYNFHKNLYVRAGLLTKVAGSTDVVARLNTALPSGPGTTDPLNLELSRVNNGKFSLGFVAAAGVKFELSDNLSVYAELDYQGINVKANKSSLVEGEFNATLAGQKISSKDLFTKVDGVVKYIEGLPVSPATAPYKAGLPRLYSLGGLIADEVTYSDSEDTKPTMTERPATVAPYSSLGVNFGIIYSLNFGNKKKVVSVE